MLKKQQQRTAAKGQELKSSSPSSNEQQAKIAARRADECKSKDSVEHHASMLRIAHWNGKLELECENPDLLVDLVRSLVIDRLLLKLSTDTMRFGVFEAKLGPILHELDAISSRIRQLEESETRIQTELFESADYTKNLMHQFAIANQLNEL